MSSAKNLAAAAGVGSGQATSVEVVPGDNCSGVGAKLG